MTSSTGTTLKTLTSTKEKNNTARTTTPHAYSSRQQQTHSTGPRGAGYVGGVTRPCPRHLLAYSLISILVVLCWLPDFIVALKDVSVTIPQAVKRGSNAILTCNYDMENDTLYSVKWYKGRREFYRYTPKENPAMKVFLTQSGINVERNLSNQSHVVLLAVPLNISGKFTCEISVEAPSFQTAMVSGEMEVVELPEEQASVTGIQPRYRIGDLVDGNCSIKYSKPAANLTWTINGIVVPPHHIKTYQIEKYEETNLESVMSAIHFMVTTQHFIKGQMRLKCTASIFDIFKEEIESIIEEDRPRIMASGRSYDAHSYPHDHDNSGGYEDHNESYLTYFSAKSSASPTVRSPFATLFQYIHKLLQHFPTLSLLSIKTRICHTLTTFIIDIERYYEKITHSGMTTYCMKLLQQQQPKQQQQQQLIKLITVMAVLLKIHQLGKRWWWRQVAALLVEVVAGNEMATSDAIKKKSCNCSKGHKVQEQRWHVKETTTKTLLYSYQDMQHHQQQQLLQQELKTQRVHCYLCEQKEESDTDAVVQANSATTSAAAADDCQRGNEQCLAANQNVINENVLHKHTNKKITKVSYSGSTTMAAATDCQQQHMSQTLDVAPSTTSMASLAASTSSSSASSSSLSPAIIVSAAGSAYRETAYALDSFPLCENAFDATESNNANYMSKDQTLLMTSSTNATPTSNSIRTPALHSIRKGATSSVLVATTKASPSIASTYFTSSASTTSSSSCSLEAFSRFSWNNNCLMAFIGELLLHQC